jgi:hypothetical protein
MIRRGGASAHDPNFVKTPDEAGYRDRSRLGIEVDDHITVGKEAGASLKGQKVI